MTDKELFTAGFEACQEIVGSVTDRDMRHSIDEKYIKLQRTRRKRLIEKAWRNVEEGFTPSGFAFELSEQGNVVTNQNGIIIKVTCEILDEEKS